MSIDFGGTIFAKVKKEALCSLKNIENVCYYDSTWSDNKCGPTCGYSRETILFETKDYIYNYVVDNRIFSGFINSDRIVVVNKNTKKSKTYKLEKQNENINNAFYEIINTSYKLDVKDYEYIQEDNFEYYGEKEKKHIPQIYINSNEKDYIFIEAAINNEDNLIAFKIDQGNLVNVFYFDRSSLNIQVMSIEEVSEIEYIDALTKANNTLIDENNKNFVFDKNIQIKLNEISLKSSDINESNNEYKQIKEICNNAIIPSIPKLNVADYNGKTLTISKEYTYISNYLVKFILHSLRITSDEDLNDYYYEDDRLIRLKLKLVIPGNVKVIGRNAFMYKYFDSIIIDEGVENIESYAFYDCNANSISLPSTIKTIHSNAFSENFNAKIHIPKNLESISKNAFSRAIINDLENKETNVMPSEKTVACKKDLTNKNHIENNKTTNNVITNDTILEFDFDDENPF